LSARRPLFVTPELSIQHLADGTSLADEICRERTTLSLNLGRVLLIAASFVFLLAKPSAAREFFAAAGARPEGVG
jgi:hypothetical protein